MRVEGFGYTKVGDCGGGATRGHWAGCACRANKGALTALRSAGIAQSQRTAVCLTSVQPRRELVIAARRAGILIRAAAIGQEQPVTANESGRPTPTLTGGCQQSW